MEQKEETKVSKRKDLFFRIVLIFTLGCLIGCLFETVLCYIQRGYFESRKGLIYGPFNPVYGFGAVLCMLCLSKIKNSFTVFGLGAFLGGTFEYLCSWIQETVFGTLSWNYSQYFMNFNGRTSLFHMICWGVFCLIFMQFIYPGFLKLIYKIKPQRRIPLSIVVTIFFVLNMLISTLACVRQEERIQKIEATNPLQKILDKWYPDERLNRIFPNRRSAKTHEKIIDITGGNQ